MTDIETPGTAPGTSVRLEFDAPDFGVACPIRAGDAVTYCTNPALAGRVVCVYSEDGIAACVVEWAGRFTRWLVPPWYLTPATPSDDYDARMAAFVVAQRDTATRTLRDRRRAARQHALTLAAHLQEVATEIGFGRIPADSPRPVELRDLDTGVRSLADFGELVVAVGLLPDTATEPE
ncbi:hypothetical protein ACFXHA_45520 [Nocardia sp. NPDC059240]|uniref:hypothetical protein n=1 Tax=Nocardia sp. NPDC059240 TaxID=3346786 RepID=UPI0036854781